MDRLRPSSTEATLQETKTKHWITNSEIGIILDSIRHLIEHQLVDFDQNLKQRTNKSLLKVAIRKESDDATIHGYNKQPAKTFMSLRHVPGELSDRLATDGGESGNGNGDLKNDSKNDKCPQLAFPFLRL